MSPINLVEEPNLEKILKESNMSSSDIKSIKNDINYFDEYYLTKERKLVKVFKQEFRKDAHMKLSPILEVRLISYLCDINIQELQDIFDKDKTPIITRAKGHMINLLKILGFRKIKNVKGKPTVLIPIKLPIPKTPFSKIDKHIHLMINNDLDEIEEIFKNEYSLRYRVVKLMWNAYPKACFVYEKKGKILGVTFNEIRDDELYMHQIFVREGYRNRGVGEALYRRRLKFARQQNLKYARARIRGEAEWFHERFNSKIDGKKEYYVKRGL